MSTFIEVAADWAHQLAAVNNRSAAIVFQNFNAVAYAQSGFQSPHHFSTAAVSLMQSDTNVEGRWMALSYLPTAACIGMAMLLRIRRIVWRDNGIHHSATLTNGQVNRVQGAPAVVFQNHNVNYALPVLLPHNPAIPRVLPRYGHLANNVFLPPHGTSNLVQQLQGADDTVRDNVCMMLAFAISSIGHGPLQNNANRSANYLGQNIAGILVDNNFQILRWGINTNQEHSSLHGEINLIRSFQANNANSLPNQGKLFTTLEPCAMCSGMIVHTAGSGNNFEVISGQTDAQVGFSALRNPNGVDGFTANARNVVSTISRLPLTPAVAFGDHMIYGQRINSPVPAQGQQFRLMQTTRYLEQHAGPVMSDAIKVLDKMAALWLPAALRPAWRASLDQFLLHVRASIRG